MSSRREERLKGMLESCTNGSSTKQRNQLMRELESKLCNAYGPKDPVAKEKFQESVRDEIQDMFRGCSRIKVSEKDLRKLEDSVRSIAIQAVTVSIPQESVHRRRDGTSSKLKDDDYQVLMESDRISYLMEEQETRNRQRNTQLEVQRVLEEQMERNRMVKAQELKEEEAYGRQVLQQSAEYHEQERENKKNQLARGRRDKELREKQMHERSVLNSRRQAAKKRREEEELLCIKDELEQEKQRQYQKMMSHKEQMNQVKAENELQKKRSELEAKQEAERERSLQTAYAKKQEAEELSRKMYFENIRNKSTQKQQMFLKATATATSESEQAEKRSAEYRAQKVRDDDRKASEKEARRKEDLEAIKLNLREQIAYKHSCEDYDREQLRIAGVKAKEDLVLAKQHESDVRRQNKTKAKELMDGLDRQIEDAREAKEMERTPTKMSHAEKKMNAGLFRKIHESPSIGELVERNLKPRTDQVKELNKKKASMEAGYKRHYYA